MQEYISVSDFSKMFGVSRQAVQKKIVNNKLNAIKFGKKYLIPKSEIERIKKQGIICCKFIT
jgi:excisionase family DNA binding protein